ncbi:hypothetical protein BDA96_01G394800 [Sorghum bicolor]|uniref:Uncharacterized protein n=2 Tax=Sorghum bicolor TaxID=4558 RepID=A0A921S3W0_SORBI|nr:hypothetical protein BDA96_01G394800 [Sorghum bicolor]KXG39366.1 hypothetical protein SORBI_3001G370800 [Sorghum bicolor]
MQKSVRQKQTIRYTYALLKDLITVRHDQTHANSTAAIFQPCSFALIINIKTMISTDIIATLFTQNYFYMCWSWFNLHAYVHMATASTMNTADADSC